MNEIFLLTIFSPFRLTGYEVLPWLTTAIAVCYGIYLTYKTSSCCDRKDKVNRQIDLDNSKVVHSFDIEDLDEKAVFCRCWKSTKV